MNRLKQLMMVVAFCLAGVQAWAGGTYHMKVGETQTLTFTPHEGVLVNTIRWESYRPKEVIVEDYIGATATIRAAGSFSGMAIVQCRYEYVKYTTSYPSEIPFPHYITVAEDFHIYVEDASPTSISLPGSRSIDVGETITLQPTIYPEGASTNLTWSANSYSVISLNSSGVVTGKSAGTSTVTVRTDNGLSASCQVTVRTPALALRATPAGGLLDKGSTVTLTASSPSAAIYYTLDGTQPTTGSSRYTGPIPINSNLTLKAFASQSGYDDSPVLTADYTVTSLTVASTQPQDGATDVSPKTIPAITYDAPVREGANFSAITLTKAGGAAVPGEAIVSDHTLYFVPDSLEESTTYTLTVPEGAVQTLAGEVNKGISVKFSVVNTTSFTFVSAGIAHVMAIKSDGSLWGWGNNSSGQLGDGTQVLKKVPVKIMNDVIFVSAGGSHTMIIKPDGSLWGWGNNSSGQLGDGTMESKVNPIKIMDDVAFVSTGNAYTMAIKSDGSLWGWGYNNDGQIGDGTRANKNSPIKIMDDVTFVSAGWRHTMAIKSDGSLWGWGNNFLYGQIGDGTTEHRLTPVKVTNDVVFVSADDCHTMAIKQDSGLWAWGMNFYGELGDGTTVNRPSPLRVMLDVAFVSAGSGHTMAIKSDGSLWGWGRNDEGQLGDGSTSRKYSPVKIMDEVTFVSAGSIPNDDGYTIAIKSDGSLWGWGKNSSYRLGDGVGWNRHYPFKIMDGGVQFPDATSVTFSQPTVQVVADGKTVLLPTVEPLNGDYENAVWQSSDEAVATVSPRGVVSGHSPGMATITLTAETRTRARLEATCLVEVLDEQESTLWGNAQTTPVRTWVQGGRLLATGLPAGVHCRLYDATGALVAEVTAHDGRLSVPLSGNGVFVLVTERGEAVKVVAPAYGK